MTAIFHHRFFPDDLDAIVPYVAPISFGAQDQRYLTWLAQIGPPDGACRNRVKEMEVELIERRVEVAQHFIATDPLAVPFRPEVLEALVTFPAFGFHWGFWQAWGSPQACAALPLQGGPVEALAAWFPFNPSYAFGFGFDPEVSPYGYQVANELGSQAIDQSHLQGPAAQVDYSVLPQVPPELPPWGRDPTFDPNPMMEVDTFLRNEAHHVLGIYGAWDPWSGGIITVDEANDSTVVVVPEVGHGAQIALLPEDQQNQLLDRLSTWIGRSSLVAPTWTEARARMAAHQPDHQLLVQKSLEAARSSAP